MSKTAEPQTCGVMAKVKPKGMVEPSPCPSKYDDVCAENVHHSVLSLGIGGLKTAPLQRLFLPGLAKPALMIQLYTIHAASLFICIDPNLYLFVQLEAITSPLC